MDRTIPPGAALLLEFIGNIEAPKGYNTIYGNNQHRLKTPLTQMTIGAVILAQSGWTKAYGSSASGRYQFMKATLIELSRELKLSSTQILTPDLQDRLGYHLLKRRGYEEYMAGQISRTAFGKRLAQEWASLPVLEATRGRHKDVKRGDTYYAGDKLNKELVAPLVVERVLDQVKATTGAVTGAVVPIVETLSAPKPGAPAAIGVWAALMAAILATVAATWSWIVSIPCNLVSLFCGA